MTLVERLEKELARNCHLNNWDLGFKAAIEIVKQHSDWVSVDEQKPQDDIAYLVLCDDGSVWIGHYNLPVKPNDWYLHGWSAQEGWHPFVITHFMLPPKPPSEAQEKIYQQEKIYEQEMDKIKSCGCGCILPSGLTQCPDCEELDDM
jgi:hypothetical protein